MSLITTGTRPDVRLTNAKPCSIFVSAPVPDGTCLEYSKKIHFCKISYRASSSVHHNRLSALNENEMEVTQMCR
jgi:hypothetical protein